MIKAEQIEKFSAKVSAKYSGGTLRKVGNKVVWYSEDFGKVAELSDIRGEEKFEWSRIV